MQPRKAYITFNSQQNRQKLLKKYNSLNFDINEAQFNLEFKEPLDPEYINWTTEKSFCQRFCSGNFWRPLAIILCLMACSTILIYYIFFITANMVGMRFFINPPNVDCEVVSTRYSKDLTSMAFTEWLELGGDKFNFIQDFNPQTDLSR